MKNEKYSVDTARYSRQINYAHIGREGQQKLAEASVAIIGCGALGSVSAEILTRAGVGKLLLVDRDVVEFSNLQRQLLYTEKDASQAIPKAVAAKNHLVEINSDIVIEAEIADLSHMNVRRLLQAVDAVIDGTDNFETRQLVNDAAVEFNLPWIYGGAIGGDGMVKGVLPGESSCFRCLMDELPGVGETPTCETAGILAPTSISVAALQSSILIKYLVTGSMDTRLHILDLWNSSQRSIEVPQLKNCPACVKKELIYLSGDVGGRATELCGRDTVQVSPAMDIEINFENVIGRLSPLGEIRDRKYYLAFDDGDLQISIFKDGRCLVHGTSDVNRARAAVSRYLGG